MNAAANLLRGSACGSGLQAQQGAVSTVQLASWRKPRKHAQACSPAPSAPLQWRWPLLSRWRSLQRYHCCTQWRWLQAGRSRAGCVRQATSHRLPTSNPYLYKHAMAKCAMQAYMVLLTHFLLNRNLPSLPPVAVATATLRAMASAFAAATCIGMPQRAAVTKPHKGLQPWGALNSLLFCTRKQASAPCRLAGLPLVMCSWVRRQRAQLRAHDNGVGGPIAANANTSAPQRGRSSRMMRMRWTVQQPEPQPQRPAFQPQKGQAC